MTDRLRSQLLAGNALGTPRDVVAHFGAMQAQDYLGALWAVGVRMKSGATEGDIERALAERTIVRWTRPELYAFFEEAGIPTNASRGLHILFALAHERVLCFGARRGKQPTFVLLDEWVPPSKPRRREEALAELAQRYLNSHAPATPADFAWWSGLTLKEASVLPGATGSQPVASVKSVHLLPPFDEYTVAYKDRKSILDPAFAKRVNAGGGILNAVLVVNGQVLGAWKRTLHGNSVKVTLSPFRPLTAGETRAVEKEIARYTAFLGRSRSTEPVQ